MDERLKERLCMLADKYETAAFSDGDPSCILRRYSDVVDVECAAFIAAMLAFGRRDQFLSKIDFIMVVADRSGGPAAWLSSGDYQSTFVPHGVTPSSKFYRFYSWNDMMDLFSCLRGILAISSSLGNHIHARYESVCHECAACGTRPPHLSDVLCDEFTGCRIVPHGRNSANKRVHMFLRWMVRCNSPVDLGLWRWYSPADLMIPLDTHVIQEATLLGILPEKSGGTIKTVRHLTEALRQVWPDDPCRGDYALFGLGVDSGSDAHDETTS